MRHTNASMTGRMLAVVLAVGSITAVVDGSLDQGRRPNAPPDSEGSTIRVTTLTENGGRLDWSERLNLIAFDRLDGDRFNIYTMRPDGSDVKCLTCDRRRGSPAKSVGNPAWHPSGDYIVFQAQNDYKGLGKITDYFANPGAGVNNDVWVMDRDGRRFWRLTNTPPRTGGVLHPQFSRDGRRLFWAERVDAKGLSGTWSLRLADFVPGDNVRIENEKTFQPGAAARIYESHGFSPDDELLFSGNPGPGFGNIYLFNPRTNALKDLTPTPEDWDEHAHFSPDGRKIVWMTSRGIPGKVRAERLRTDYWIMDPDGSNKRRLTYFNEPGHPESEKDGLTAADFAWSPDGSRIAAYLITDVRKGGKIVMIDLRGSTSNR